MSTSPNLNPAAIYTPQPLTVVNFDFEQDPGILPPEGWTVGGGLGALPVPVLSYDTATPYEGLYSLIVDASAEFGGVLQLAGIPVQPGQIYSVTAAIKSNSGDPAVAQFSFYDANKNYISSVGVGTTAGVWQLLTSVNMPAPPNAAYGELELLMEGASGGIGEFDVVSVTLVSTAIPYYLSLFTSQYQSSPNFKALAQALLQPFVDTAVCAAAINAAFDLVNESEGNQLDILGLILGASRTLPFTPTGTLQTLNITGTYVNSGSVEIKYSGTPSIAPAPGQQYLLGGLTTETWLNGLTITLIGAPAGTLQAATGHSTYGPPPVPDTGTAQLQGPTSAILDDAHYRILLQAKVLFNQFNGLYQGANSILWAAWQQLFPGGHIYITDNQNMTATLFLVGVFDPLVQQMITNGLIVPRCQGVKFIYEFATLPLFGFDDLNPSFVAGFDTGFWG